MNKYSIAIAAFISSVLNWAIFIEPKPTCTDYIGTFPALMIILSMCFILTDLQLPERYRKSSFVFFIVETIISIFAIEVIVIYFWARIENVIVKMIKLCLSQGNLYEEMGGDRFLGFLLTAFTSTILLASIKVTKSTETIIRSIVSLNYEFYQLIEKFKTIKSTSKVSPCSQSQVITPIPCEIRVIQQPQSSIMRNPCCPIHGDLEMTQKRRRRH
ncbi:hypothetical protein PVAND_006507 [Polypedilum vanderplanki]|uniref:Uncharacterized protein n=1 Tax=Polypedilum vanderplanki TaxID=319348 RepID=A0A9J6C4D9_POLVA|nr:hypothetical protein PVAND_006507 [Polypedilum vanderplanki]